MKHKMMTNDPRNTLQEAIFEEIMPASEETTIQSIKATIGTKALQEMARPYARYAIETCAKIMLESKDEKNRLVAAKIILDKTLPNLVGQSVKLEDNQLTISVRRYEDTPETISGEVKDEDSEY